MRTVAMIGPDFPPCCRPSALRVRSFASHLAEYGWRPIVLTTQAHHYREAVLDLEVEKLLPASLEIVRTGAIPAGLARRLGFGDMGLRSFWHHWRALASLCKAGRVDLTFISVPPSVPMLLGRLAWERFGVPYVIDYQDPWRTEVYWRRSPDQRPPKWASAYWLARMLEPVAVKRAAHLVAVSDATHRDVLAHYPDLGRLGATEIPFGAEPADFDYLRANPRPNPIFDRNDGRLHLSYAGAFIPPMEGALRALFSAVATGLRRQPALFGRLCLHFAGTNYASAASGPGPVTRIAYQMGLASVVHEDAARIPYLDSLRVLMDSHALLLLGSNEPHYSPSKAFAYLAARRPVLALCFEQSNVVPLLRQAGHAELVTFSASGTGSGAEISPDAVSAALSITLANAESPAQPAGLQGWTASDMAEKLAGVFNSVCAEGRVQ
ncbi:MAG: glycosyltransferase [Bryobacteraceae bacterium]